MNPPFIIYSLPRSRTLWLSEFLTCGEWECGHDVLASLYSLVDILKYLKTPKTGVADTGLVMGWKALRKFVPEASIIAIHRPVEDVRKSLSKMGFGGDFANIDLLNAKLEELRGEEDVLHIEYEELNSKEICEDLFQYCTGERVPAGRWERMKDKNIQIDAATVPARVADMVNNLESWQLTLKVFEAFN